MQAEAMIDRLRPVVVNYCDFTCHWDWLSFKRWVVYTECDGAIPAYKGFHPHTLGTTNYAYMKESSGWLLDIQEKQPFTDNRMEEYASSGTYYYASGDLMLEAFRDTVSSGLALNGEYYVSLTYKALLAAGKLIAIYPLQHFMQWGTPEDVHEYRYWSKAFRDLLLKPVENKLKVALVVPMAGLGERFRREGYSKTKPLISVSGLPMVLQAARDLGSSEHIVFVLRDDMPGVIEVCETLSKWFPGAILPRVAEVTEGQACTALIGLDSLESAYNYTGPITFGACDNGVLYEESRFKSLLDDETIDVIVWCTRGYANAVRYPDMYGWIEVDGIEINRVSVKKSLQNPSNDPIVIGTFTFRRGTDMRRSVERLIDRNGRVNGEFYLDSCINEALDLGLRCVIFEVDSYLSWGTPNDLKTFNYWQSCFHLWKGHPYNMEADARVEYSAALELAREYGGWKPMLGRRAKRKIHRHTIQEILRFLIVGTTTVGLDYLSYHALLKISFEINTAKALGFIAGTLFAYVANKFWTFSNGYHKPGTWWRFPIVYGINLSINVCLNAWILSILVARPTSLTLAFMIATGASAILNFIGMKYFVFPTNNSPTKDQKS